MFTSEYLHIAEIQNLDEIDLNNGWQIGDRVYVMDFYHDTCYCVNMDDNGVCSWLDLRQIDLLN